MDALTCSLCKKSGTLHDIESPAIRICESCRVRMQTTLTVVCSGCNTVWWIPKTPENIMFAAERSGVTPQQVMDNASLQLVYSCRNCYEAVREFAVQSQWIQ